jgi:hypothetical protein
MITAQVFFIVSFVIAWSWWVVWLISFVALIFFQMMWCYRQSKADIIAVITIATVAGALCVTIAIIMLVHWENASWCLIFTFTSDRFYLPLIPGTVVGK